MDFANSTSTFRVLEGAAAILLTAYAIYARRRLRKKLLAEYGNPRVVDKMMRRTTTKAPTYLRVIAVILFVFSLALLGIGVFLARQDPAGPAGVLALLPIGLGLMLALYAGPLALTGRRD